ncbi:MAG TPA: LPS-assembly protein LptD, partial [Rhodospirillales bacterium]|nr:LPS-assembly protein LptD [Rhodospirillales bacterium]
YFDLAPNRDLTLTPLFSSERAPMLKVELRDLETFGTTTLEFSGTYAKGYQRHPDQKRNTVFRGHVKARGEYALDATDRAGFDIALSSDNTYLETYGLGGDDVLTNRLYYERYEEGRYAAVNAYGFQGLRETDDQGTIPVALPLVEYHQKGAPLVWGSYWTIDAVALALTRGEGLDTQRLTTELGWELPRLGPIGDLWRLRLSLRGDVYRTDGNPTDYGGGGSRVTGRILPRAYLGWSLPLVGEAGSWQQLVEPVAAVMIDRSDGNDSDIPNEDSQSFEFDETNLFEPSRFTGIDRVEEGARVAYGVRAAAIGPSAFRVSGVLGQIVDLTGSDVTPENSGLEGRFSDFVGRLDLRPNPFLDLSYRFRFAADDFVFRRNDVIASFGPPRLRFRVSYLELSDEPLPGSERKRKELVAAVRLGLTDELSIGAQTRRDLTENETVATSGALVYRNPCFVLTAGIERRFTTKGELNDETTFTLRIGFAGLGDIGTSTSLEDVQ